MPSISILKRFPLWAVFIIFVFSGCFSDWKDDRARLTIVLGSGDAGAGVGRAAFPPTDATVGNLEHTVELTNGSETITLYATGQTTIEVAVSAGTWDITVRTSVGTEKYAVGSISATLQPGQDNVIEITMYPMSLNVPGANLAAKLAWLRSYAQSGVEYTVNVTANETIGPQDLSYGRKKPIIILKGNTEQTISLNSNGSLFSIGSGVTLTLGNNITLSGRSSNTAPLVNVGGTLVMSAGSKITGNNHANDAGGGVFVEKDGTFNMRGGTISGNKAKYGAALTCNGTFNMYAGAVISANESVMSGAVDIYKGKFTMHGGTIGTTSDGGASTDPVSGGNTITGTDSGAGGVLLQFAEFTMNNGTISGNTGLYGGGVGVRESTFTMNNGKIFGNTARNGGGVNVGYGGKFDMKGGIIYNNTANTRTVIVDGQKQVWDGNGGGVSVEGRYYDNDGKEDRSVTDNATFNKQGGTIVGTDEYQDSSGYYAPNKANQGAAAYAAQYDSANWDNTIINRREYTAGPGVVLTYSHNTNGRPVVGRNWDNGGDTPEPVSGTWTWEAWDPGPGSTINYSQNGETHTVTGTLGSNSWANAVAFPDDATLAALKTATAISFKARGNGKSYRLSIGTDDTNTEDNYDHYCHTFTAPATETTVTLYVNNFKQDEWGKAVSFNRNNILWLMWGPVDTGSFNLSIRDLTLIQGGTVDPEPPVSGGTPVPGNDLAAKLTWLKNNAANNGNYIVEVTKNETLTNANLRGLSYGSNTVAITLKGDNTEREITWFYDGRMFDIGTGVTLTLGNNITLKGNNSDSNVSSVVLVGEDSSKLIMDEGSKITDNIGTDGGGVNVYRGTFTMNSGIISNNTATQGAGVMVGDYGTFTMNGGIIGDTTTPNQGNTADRGGGVYVMSGRTFTMYGGRILNNTADQGGGVYVNTNPNGIFTMYDGEITGNIATTEKPGVWGVFTNVNGTVQQ